MEIDIRQILPAIRVPTLVMQRTGDRLVPPEVGAYVADRIPGAQYLELPGVDFIPWFEDPDSILEAVEHFLAGVWEERPWEDVQFDRVLTRPSTGPLAPSVARTPSWSPDGSSE